MLIDRDRFTESDAMLLAEAADPGFGTDDLSEIDELRDEFDL
jgi:hypothetical protein